MVDAPRVVERLHWDVSLVRPQTLTLRLRLLFILDIHHQLLLAHSLPDTGCLPLKLQYGARKPRQLLLLECHT